jgi:hypothetical protein
MELTQRPITTLIAALGKDGAECALEIGVGAAVVHPSTAQLVDSPDRSIAYPVWF